MKVIYVLSDDKGIVRKSGDISIINSNMDTIEASGKWKLDIHVLIPKTLSNIKINLQKKIIKNG